MNKEENKKSPEQKKVKEQKVNREITQQELEQVTGGYSRYHARTPVKGR